MTTPNVHFSSKKHDWVTPDALFARLHRIYAFDLDVACSAENCRTKVGYHWPALDGLALPWADARVWCNPPYGREIGKWTRKAAEEREKATLIVMLVPARTDTAWWHAAMLTARVEFLRGRLTFKGAAASAPFPSALFFWGC